MRWSTKCKIPRDRTLNAANGDERREAPPPAPCYSKHASDCSRSGGMWGGGCHPAVTVQLMCVDSADVIYSLFSAPAVLTNELQAARRHAADNAAGLLLQVSTRTSPRLTRFNCRHASKLHIPPSRCFGLFCSKKEGRVSVCVGGGTTY